MLAGGVILLWFSLHSLAHSEFWWSKFNVAAGWFYDTAVYQAGFSWVTLCGASVILLFYCIVGACYAWCWEALFPRRAFLTTALFVAAVYLVAVYRLWPSFGPFARLWFPWTATVPAHVALFAALARYPASYIRLINEFGDPAWLPRSRPEPPINVQEKRRSGPGFDPAGEAPSPTESAKD